MSKAIRVLQVFARMDRGGAESMIMNIYRNIDREKIQFDFIVHTNEKCAFDDEIEELGGKIYRISKYNGYNHFTYKNEWKAFFKEHPEYKMIHGHVRSTASIYLKVAKKNGLSTIIHSHSTSNGTGIAAVVKNLMKMPIKNNADYLFSASIEAGKWLFGDAILNQKNFYIIKNPIEAEKFNYNRNTRDKIRTKLNINNEIVIGHVGRFDKGKNQIFLVEVFKDILKKDPNSLLIFVGDGKTKNSIQLKVEKEGLSDKVLFLGVRSNINEIMQAMDIFVFPSLYEGFGLAVIESQASGLPTIASDSVPLETKITDSIYFKSLNCSPQEWADVIGNLNLNTRESRYKEIVNAGFDVRDSAQRLERLYIEISQNIELY